jgi:hypothetical protein
MWQCTRSYQGYDRSMHMVDLSMTSLIVRFHTNSRTCQNLTFVTRKLRTLEVKICLSKALNKRHVDSEVIRAVLVEIAVQSGTILKRRATSSSEKTGNFTSIHEASYSKRLTS